MRLSEAIRLGAMISPQTRGGFFKHGVSEGRSVVATCALGAAALAVGGSESAGFGLPAFSTWPVLRMLVPHAELPAGISASWRSMRLADVIILLNDRQGWTRTRIAEWVEHFEERHASEIEPSDQPAQPVEPEAQDLDDLDEEGLVPALL